MDNDTRRLRIADDTSIDDASQAPPAATGGAPSFVGITFTVTTYPTVAARYYAVHCESVTGTESEGSSGAFAARSATIYALNLGTVIPPSGTYVICVFVSNRWVFRYDG